MSAIEVQLTGPHIALCDLVKVAGLATSGGGGKALVASGVVRVDGVVETRKTCKIRPGQVITVGGDSIRALAAPVDVETPAIAEVATPAVAEIRNAHAIPAIAETHAEAAIPPAAEMPPAKPIALP